MMVGFSLCALAAGESGAEATAVQTLRAQRAAWHLADIGYFQTEKFSSCSPAAFMLKSARP